MVNLLDLRKKEEETEIKRARKINWKIRRNIVFSAILLIGVAFSIVTVMWADAPDPGHSLSEVDLSGLLVDSTQGGTGLSAIGLANQVLGVNSAGDSLEYKTIDKTFIGLGNVEDTALSTWLGTDNLITLGTITTGSWNGSAIGVAYGGTGQSSDLTQGGILFGSTPTVVGVTAIGSSGQILQSAGTGTPSWSTATYPSTAGTTGNYLKSDGTNFLSTPEATLLQSTPADPTGTSDLTGTMMGLGASITPVASGKVLIIISGDIANNTNNRGGQIQIRYGTGSAPVNGDSLTGTPVGGLVKMSQANPSDKKPFSLNAIVSGLTFNTNYWIDISLAAITSGTATTKDISISVIEL